MHFNLEYERLSPLRVHSINYPICSLLLLQKKIKYLCNINNFFDGRVAAVERSTGFQFHSFFPYSEIDLIPFLH